MTNDEKLDCLIAMMRDVSLGLHSLESVISCGYDKTLISSELSMIATSIDSALSNMDSQAVSRDNNAHTRKKSFWQ